MIVQDSHIEVALAYLAVDPHPVAVARKALTDAENTVERLFAELYPDTEGTVRERECDIERNASYRDAKLELATAQMEYERHRARIRSSEMLVSVWQSEGANRRASEQVR